MFAFAMTLMIGSSYEEPNFYSKFLPENFMFGNRNKTRIKPKKIKSSQKISLLLFQMV